MNDTKQWRSVAEALTVAHPVDATGRHANSVDEAITALHTAADTVDRLRHELSLAQAIGGIDVALNDELRERVAELEGLVREANSGLVGTWEPALQQRCRNEAWHNRAAAALGDSHKEAGPEDMKIYESIARRYTGDNDGR